MLDADLVPLQKAGIVSVVGVADPFCSESLERSTTLRTRPFKTLHYVDNSLPLELAPRIRYKIRKANRGGSVERLPLRSNLDSWVALYNEVAEAKNYALETRFPREYHAGLAQMDCIETHAYLVDGCIEAMQLWMIVGDIVYLHLAAASALGRKNQAGYALAGFAVERFDDVSRVVFGGGAGARDRADDGLARFKSGFCNATTKSTLFSAVLDASAYASLAEQAHPAASDDYFPIYRAT